MKAIGKSMLIVGIMVGLLGTIFSRGHAATYTVDAAHSTIGFAVKHMLVSTTRGAFTDYSGSITFEPTDPSAFGAEATIQVSSINTHNEKRDDHLRGADFFDAATYATITFKATELTAQSPVAYILTGDLTIRDVTQSIEIPVEIAGPVTSPFGGSVIGLVGEAVINRQDFGVSWSKTLDAGGLVVSDEVRLIIELEAMAQ